MNGFVVPDAFTGSPPFAIKCRTGVGFFIGAVAIIESGRETSAGEMRGSQWGVTVGESTRAKG
jgi:hypothetical protein